MCDARTSTCSAAGSRQARQSTIPSVREYSAVKPTSGGNVAGEVGAEPLAARAAQAAHAEHARHAAGAERAHDDDLGEHERVRAELADGR